VMDDSLVYRKSGLGAAQLAATHGGTLSRPERHVLILLDGRRTVAELSDLLGAGTVRRVIPELLAKGFAKEVDLKLAAAWDGAITQIYVPRAEPSRPKRDWRSDGHPVVRFVLATMVTIVGTYWAADRYRSHAHATWGLDQTLAQVRPIDSNGVPTSTDAIDAYGSEFPAPATITPISRLRTAPTLESAATSSPARAAPLVVVREHPHPSVARNRSRDESPAHETALPTESPPVADSAAASAVKVAAVDPPVAPSLAPQDVNAAGTSAVPTESPAFALGAAPIALPAPIAAADPPAKAPEQVAMASPAPAAQPVSDPVTLRPLRHDPPGFPERAKRDGIVESKVRVRLWVTPEGKVDQVDVLEATPPGVFDDAVRRALSLWTFEPPGHPLDQVVDLTLKQ
jgi:TonB family protein